MLKSRFLIVMAAVIFSTGAWAKLNQYAGFDASASQQRCPSIDRAEVFGKMKIEDIQRDARLAPEVVENQKVLGFRFLYVKPCGFFESIGFQPEDLLVQVEDTSTNSPVGGMIFFNYLRGTESFSVKIVRDGKKLKLSIK